MSTRFLQIEPTTKCNFTCGYCCGRVMPQRHMSLDMFQQILREFPDVEHIELQGEGEPLLHPSFFEMADECRRRGIRVSCITNGSLITEKFARAFVRLEFNRVNVSMDTADPAAFKRIRGGNLSTVVKGVGTLMAAMRAANADRPRVGFSVTVLRSTLEAIDGIVDLYEQLGLNGGIKLQPLQRMASYVAVYEEGLKGEMLEDREWHELRRTLATRPRLLRAVQESRDGQGFQEELFAGWSDRAPVCPWLERGAYIDFAGHVTGCCQIKHHESFGFGQIGVRTVTEIEGQRDAIRRVLHQGEVPAACAACPLAATVAHHHGSSIARDEARC